MMIYIYFVFIHKYFPEAGIMSIKSSFNGIYNNCRVQLHIMSNKTFIYLIDSVVFFNLKYWYKNDDIHLLCFYT